MTKIKVGVLGTGSMGVNHVRIYKALSHLCYFAGIFDEDREKCSRVATQFSVKAFPSMEELFSNVDALSIVVPTVHHFMTASAAIEQGKHLLIEKPITQTVEQGKALIRQAQQQNTILQVGHVERFNPAVMLLPEILNGKKIIALDFKRMSPFDPRIKDVDVVQDLMIHDIDVLRSLLPNKINKLEAVGVSHASKARTDYAVASLLLEGDILANLTASRLTEQKIRTLCITTAEAYIELDYIDRKILVTRATHLNFGNGLAQSYRQENLIEKVFVPNHEPLMLEIESFIQCIQNGTKPAIDGNDGVQALEIVNSIQSCIASQCSMI